MNWNEVSSRLAQEAEAVAGMLLPNGKRQGPEWVAGSVEGEAGESLKVKWRSVWGWIAAGSSNSA